MSGASGFTEKVKWLDSILNVDRMIEGDKNSSRQIRSYFRNTRLAYRKFHSSQGFMHFRVSKGDTLSDEDIYYQPNVISGYIRSGSCVLELGPGQGANLLYLAPRHPDADFCGLDLLPAKLKDPPPNLRMLKQDYSNMPNIKDDSVDVVYGIETIVYSSEKDKIFREVYRVLKPGGVFIVYDYALRKKYEDYDPIEQRGIAILSKCGACAMIESAAEWERRFTDNGFRELSITDLSKETLPDLKRLQKKASHVIDRPGRAKRIAFFCSRHLINNVVIGYLGYDSCREGIGYYKEWIFRKP